MLVFTVANLYSVSRSANEGGNCCYDDILSSRWHTQRMETIKTSKALFRRLIWVVQSLGDKLQLVSATIKSRGKKKNHYVWRLVWRSRATVEIFEVLMLNEKIEIGSVSCRH